MKKFTSRKTGEIIYGKFGEATKSLRQKGYDWQLIKEDGNRYLFCTLEEFIQQYQEEINPIFFQIEQRINKFLNEKTRN